MSAMLVNGELYEDHFCYRRLSVYKSQMAICFKCWKLVKITEVESRKEYYSGWERWAYEVESKDLMKNHWYNLYSKVIIQSTPNFEPAYIPPSGSLTN
ncbi:hypothetical protein RhiirA1_481973 [Rhizophagus irregularis]|uniref:Uncharacterized protein n=3 Tax=Rhizophagus irregularis TaxID=588596 RepID=A0A2N0QMF9_9GLOM|nr:hypothetical protein GLOIN_2v1772141 [Rhizophagus irregularis DAOM 181602=DAOM 197198]PKC52237.1 hypothetical protein RhiirA1_481973 [Rhizophagus irregularis]POG73781.1 hypothetical protein GLOIN_2v1772141 [Rhizophagus irregularis DAOM 181602=DAOM 197198]|eukprot:XP_025180647.1 hypothetical protein GLOIN_2v1772141 [Rhizophagus irregularis DAOM 181602=DAOM 197198]